MEGNGGVFSHRGVDQELQCARMPAGVVSVYSPPLPHAMKFLPRAEGYPSLFTCLHHT